MEDSLKKRAASESRWVVARVTRLGQLGLLRSDGGLQLALLLAQLVHLALRQPPLLALRLQNLLGLTIDNGKIVFGKVGSGEKMRGRGGGVRRMMG